MAPMEGDYELSKAIQKLRTLNRSVPNREDRWRRTSWYGVTEQTMRILQIQGVVEKRRISDDQPVQWRQTV